MLIYKLPHIWDKASMYSKRKTKINIQWEFKKLLQFCYNAEKKHIYSHIQKVKTVLQQNEEQKD